MIDRYVTLASRLLKVPPEPLQAIANVESGRRYYNEHGKLVIRFEVHIFWQLWGQANQADYRKRFDGNDSWQGADDKYKSDHDGWRSIHESQHTEHDAYRIAGKLNPDAADKSISMGAFQIMGFNASRIGYDNAGQMYRSFSAAPLNQVIGFCLFLQTHGLIDKIRQEDFLGFATIYNGSGQAHHYADLMRRQIELLRQGSDRTP